ncbi:MAG TPA: hypothetical protein VHP80_18745, partial [Candidatus Acidoferrum sp.]|nr:hypothetical protein [Candidatus Acidoferrum sp.]
MSAFAADATVRYTLSIAHPEKHFVHVKMELPPGPPERDLQLPVWNALYQVRDFSQYVIWVKASDAAGHALRVQDVDKSRWHLSGAANGAVVEYEIFADQAGPYNAQLNEEHGFFNFAEILMYAVDRRSSPAIVTFADVPPAW